MSLDLDFDANKHIKLESVIKESFLSFYGENKLNLININLKKDTDDVKRYVIDYKNSYNNEIFKLKIEMSFRRKFDINETDILNNKRIFKLLFYLISKKRLSKTEQLQGIYMILFLWVIIMLRFLIQNKLILLRTFIKILTIQ